MMEIRIYFISICILAFHEEYAAEFPNVPWVSSLPPSLKTPSPININTSAAICVEDAYNRFLSISNDRGNLIKTGKHLIMYSDGNSQTYTIGGVVGLVEYQFVAMYFNWDLELIRAGSSINGKGTPFERILILKKNTYTVEDAANHRDGWFISVQRINIVEEAADNEDFKPFADKVRKFCNGSTSVPIVTATDTKWARTAKMHKEEYCYPGSFTNCTTGVTTYSSVICTRDDQDAPIISKKQFLEAFGCLGYSNVAKLETAPDTPIGHFKVEIKGRSPLP